MEPDPGAVRALVERVGGFHLRRGPMKRAQSCIEGLLASGDPISQVQVDAYLAEVQRYFTGFGREARSHLEDLDRRLGRVSQLQFNLTAERGVAARRVEVTQGVLQVLAELAQR